MRFFDRISALKRRFKMIERAARIVIGYSVAKDCPKAVGWLRDFQEANLKILKEVDRVCRANGIKYWLAYGTLLGAVRHRGSIPWDDDIDIMMMRDDYNKFLRIFSSVADSKYNVKTYFENEWNFSKVHVDFTNLLFVDVFPVDYYCEKVDTLDGKLRVTADLIHARAEVRKRLCKSKLADCEKRDILDGIYEKMIMKGKGVEKNNSIIISIDFVDSCCVQCFDYEDIFPLSEVEYDGSVFFAPNRADRILTYMYGDYMLLPDEIAPHHKEFKDVNLMTVLQIKDFIGRK